jgi:hypothetical protein
VVERLDDLEVGVVGHRQDGVAGAEPRVDPAVGELAPEEATDAVRGGVQAVGTRGVREVVQAHAESVSEPFPVPDAGVVMS